MGDSSIGASAEQVTFSGRGFLSSYIKEQKYRLWMAVFAGALATIAMLVQWVSFSIVAQSTIVDSVSIDQHYPLLILFAAAALGQATCVRLQSHFSQQASLNVRNSIRDSMLRQWRAMSPIQLKQASAGALATQWVEEVEVMDGYFSRYWPQQMLAIISPLLILGTVAYFNWICAILLLISAPLIPLFMVLVGMGADKLNQKYSTVRQRLAGHFLDRVSHLSSIRLLCAEQEVFGEVTQRSNNYREVIMKTLKVAFLSSTVLEFFTSVAIASLAIYIGFSLYGAINWGPADSLTLFTGLTILILAPEFFQPLRNLSQYYHDRAAAMGAAANLVNLYALPTKKLPSETLSNALCTADERETVGTNSNTYRLDFKAVSIGYENNKVLTDNLNLSLETGDILAVSGPSGCGKTTLLNTIAGFLPTLNGEIKLSPMAQQPLAYLPQKPWIKNDSIYNNLAVLAPQASREQMLKVMETLGLADELLTKHNGLDTVLGEHGQGLSGGQMQRIALARVLLNPTPVVLIDEPTAKLDALSKQYVINVLKVLKENSIVIVVTHDPILFDIANIHISLNSNAGNHYDPMV